MPSVHQILLGNSIAAGGYSFVNSEAATIVAAMTDVVNVRRGNIDTFVGSLKSGAISGSNIWNKLDFLQMFSAHNSGASLINWKAPGTRDATTVGTCVFTTDRGYSSTTSGSYVDTNFNPSTHGVNFTLNSGMIGGFCRTTGQVAGSFYGYFDGTNGNTLSARNASNQSTGRLNQAAAYTGSSSVTDGKGLFCIDRSGSGAIQLRRNATSIGSGTTASSSIPNGTLAVLNVTKSGAPLAVEISCVFAGASLTFNEHTDLYNAINVWNTALGV